MKTGNDLTPPASYLALIVGDIDDPQTNYVVVLYAYNIIYIYIHHKLCASETCKEACKIASEFQVSRRRAAELQSAKKERNYTSKTNLIHSSLSMVRTWFIGSGRNPHIGHCKAMLILGITWYNHPEISGYPMFDQGSNMDGEKKWKISNKKQYCYPLVV